MDFKLPFPAVQKDAWLQKVTEDLKGKKSWEDFIRSVDGIELDPFIVPNQSTASYLPLDRLFNQMEKGVFLSVTNADNSVIKTYLNHGASALYLHISGEAKPEKLLDEIHLEYIFVILNIENKNVASDFIRFFEKNYADKSIQTFIYSGSEMLYPNLSFMLESNINDSYVSPLVNILSEIEKNIQTIKPFRGILNFSIGKDFLMTIAALRAIRILWENMVSYLGYEEDIPLILCATPDPAALSEEPNQGLIEMSYITLSAILGNVDVFFSKQSGIDPSIQEGLKILNIQHIFLEEGKLDLVKDPVAGSLYIEQATVKLAEKVWENFHNK